MAKSMRTTACIMFVIATCVSCSNNPAGAPYSVEYQALLKNRALIVVTDVEDKPIDCLLYDPHAADSERLIRLEVLTSEAHEELGFYVLGDQVNSELDCNLKFLKSHKPNAKRGASFEIHEDEIFSFSGNGFATSRLDSSHLDYALEYSKQVDSVHRLQVVKYYLLESIEHEKMLQRIVCSHNENTNEVVLQSELHIYGSSDRGTSEIKWADAEDRWVKWKNDFLTKNGRGVAD